MRITVFLFIFLFVGFSIQAQEAKFEVGDLAPNFSGVNQDSFEISSKELLEDGDLVLVFYRGAWCGYCQKHMSELEDSLSFILDLGANVIAVTSEKPSSITKMEEKSGASFSIIHDQDYSIMKSFGVLYELNKETVPKFFSMVLKRTADANGNDDNLLPVPATFVIGHDGIIKWMHFDPDYTKRASIADILEACDK
ncbi:MAG: peroxiredoxin [Chitinophagales bacterium]|jgi:peroxiredoxin